MAKDGNDPPLDLGMHSCNEHRANSQGGERRKRANGIHLDRQGGRGREGAVFRCFFFALLVLFFFFSCPLKQSRRNGSLFLPSLYFCL